MLISMKKGLIFPENVQDFYTMGEFESVLSYLQDRLESLKLLQYYYNQYIVWDYEPVDFFSKDEDAEDWQHKYCFSEDLRLFWDAIDPKYDAINGSGNNELCQLLFSKFKTLYPIEANRLVLDPEYSQSFVYSNDYDAMLKFVEYAVSIIRKSLMPLSSMFEE